MPQRLLLIDISNSFTKLALADETRLLQRKKIATNALEVASLSKLVARWKFSRVVLCSVVPAKNAVVTTTFSQPILQLSHKVALGIGIDYPRPASIGADRLANAVAAADIYGAPAVVVDFGTAVTFDIISSGKKYLGGVIAPGLEVMTDYLYDRTALLPRIDLLEPVSAIGRTTRDAMLAGAIHGYRGLVKEILAQIRMELGSKKLHVIATGGYANLIAARLPALKIVNPDLTLEGLRIIALRNPL
ncbi:MAG: type III pantothenate kinase [Chthoniobacterales bacterium]